MHVHVVPRWQADTNFTATTANTRLLPLPLVDTWKMIRDAWPSAASG
jgi:diadenosine tetraphosphate (Ap4A) HIT family hydrolase